MAEFSPRLEKYHVGHEVVTKVEKILDFIEEPKDATIHDIVESLYKKTDLKHLIQTELENLCIDVVIIEDDNDMNSTLEYLKRRRKSDDNFLAYVPMCVTDKKNTAWLKCDFPCPVAFHFYETDINSMNRSAIESACTKEFGHGTVTFRKQIIRINDCLKDYCSQLQRVLSSCNDEKRRRDIVVKAFDGNTTLDIVSDIAFRVMLEGHPGSLYRVHNSIKLMAYKSKLVDEILQSIARNVTDSIGRRLSKTEQLEKEVLDVMKTCVLNPPNGEQAFANIIFRFFEALWNQLAKIVLAVSTFCIPVDVNSYLWRGNIASLTKESLKVHKVDIVRKIDKFLQRICQTTVLKKKLEQTQNLFLPQIPSNAEGHSGCKVKAASYGTDELGRRVVGLRAENFDHIHLSCEKGTQIDSDRKTIAESTTEIERVKDFVGRVGEQGRVTIGIEERRRLNGIIRMCMQELMKKHSNLITISTSPVMSHRKGIEIKPCVVIYCFCKGVIPLEEALFPRELENTPVDVRENFAYFGSAREFHDPLRLGCSIGSSGDCRTGSVGVFVKEIDTPGQYGFLTCGHVLVQSLDPNIREKIRRSEVPVDVVQPSYMDDHRNLDCGRLIDARIGNVVYKGEVTGVDVAYVRMTKRIPKELKFPSVEWEQLETSVGDGFTEETKMGPPIFDINGDYVERCVYKFGRTSGFTRGCFSFNNMSLRMEHLSASLCQQENAEINLHNLYTIASSKRTFFEPGDSGAAVYIRVAGEIRVIGIAVGGLMSGGECFVTPIGAVLDSIEPRVEIECFSK